MQNNTSVEEDTELRDLVAQTLENKGILPKIRAQLRANVFCALEENSDSKEAIVANDDLSMFLQQPLASVLLNLVREFFIVLQLDFTLSVFEPETKFQKDYNEISREKILKQFNLSEYKGKNPILYEIVAKALQETTFNSKGSIGTGNLIENNSMNGIDASLSDEGGLVQQLDLNSTYVKSGTEKNLDATKPLDDVDDNYNNDSIDEALPSSKTSSAEHSARDLAHNIKAENSENSNNSSPVQNSKVIDTKIETKNAAAEIDLLTFTPVKDVKTADKTVSLLLINEDVTENDSKTKQNPLSVLGDLPPLNAKTESKKNQMNEIKAIIDQGLDLDKIEEGSNSPLSSKGSGKRDKSHSSRMSERLDQSETIDGEEFDEDDDLSDLINSHASSDNQFTIDETISKASNIGDHLENV